MIYALMEFGLADVYVGITLTTATNKFSNFNGLPQKKLITQSLSSPMCLLRLFFMVFKGPRFLPACGLLVPAQGPQNLLRPAGRQEERKNVIRKCSSFLAGDMHVLFRLLLVIPVHGSPFSKELGDAS